MTETERFHRETTMHGLKPRRGRVIAVTNPSVAMMRVRVTGDDFADFVSSGPTDHTRVFFPDPVTGEYNVPTPAPAGEPGFVRPTGPAFMRDFTPLRVVREGDNVCVDIDVYRHPSPGPASTWAAQAAVGQEIVMVGPRGSRSAPQGADRVLLITDETALPAAARFAAEVPGTTAVDVIAVTADDGVWVAEYLAEASGRIDLTVQHVDGPAQGDALITALDAVDPIDEGTFVFAAGEASALVPLRRHLRHGLALPRAQYAVNGYWRSGVTGYDHHEPLDPSDPD